jgi:hypothetical protein
VLVGPGTDHGPTWAVAAALRPVLRGGSLEPGPGRWVGAREHGECREHPIAEGHRGGGIGRAACGEGIPWPISPGGPVAAFRRTSPKERPGGVPRGPREFGLTSEWRFRRV